MTDWKSCSVVRDRDGDLWTNFAGMWHTPEMAPFSAENLAKYDPTPVLDADGLPVVRTVGDLTARHIGRRVRVGEVSGELVQVAGEVAFSGLRMEVTINTAPYDSIGSDDWPDVGLDTPCEVLDLGEEVEQPSELLAQVRDTIKRGWAKCPLCQGSIRQTVGLTCELCGRYHGKDGEWQ